MALWLRGSPLNKLQGHTGITTPIASSTRKEPVESVSIDARWALLRKKGMTRANVRGTLISKHATLLTANSALMPMAVVCVRWESPVNHKYLLKQKQAKGKEQKPVKHESRLFRSILTVFVPRLRWPFSLLPK